VGKSISDTNFSRLPGFNTCTKLSFSSNTFTYREGTNYLFDKRIDTVYRTVAIAANTSPLTKGTQANQTAGVYRACLCMGPYAKIYRPLAFAGKKSPFTKGMQANKTAGVYRAFLSMVPLVKIPTAPPFCLELDELKILSLANPSSIPSWINLLTMGGRKNEA